MTRLPFGDDGSIRDATQFRAKVYPLNFTAKCASSAAKPSTLAMVKTMTTTSSSAASSSPSSPRRLRDSYLRRSAGDRSVRRRRADRAGGLNSSRPGLTPRHGAPDQRREDFEARRKPEAASLVGPVVDNQASKPVWKLCRKKSIGAVFQQFSQKKCDENLQDR